jgi:glycosyltransferase involved in cell wall biosynthesis
VSVAYIVRRFPKFSETFILQEILELTAQGEHVWVASLHGPHPGEPRHPGADEIASRTCYVPGGPMRRLSLLSASMSALARAPGRCLRALAWSIRWALRERDAGHVRRFGEACYVRSRLPAGTTHIHAHFASSPASVALLLARITGLPFSFTGHARDIFELTAPELIAALVADARFVVAVSDYSREYLMRVIAPADRTKVVVVRNGIDGQRFSPPGGDAPVAGRGGVPLILSVARLVEKKGLDTLVEACGRLAAEGVAFRCEVIGEGPQRRMLETLAGRAGIDGHIALPGMKDQQAVIAAYRAATVFVLPCRRTATGDQDGLPVSIAEAMWAGVPVVTTPTSGIPELVVHGETGLLVPAGDPGALADAIVRLLNDPALRARLAGNARAAAAAAFDLGDCVTRLRRLFAAPPLYPRATPLPGSSRSTS